MVYKAILKHSGLPLAIKVSILSMTSQLNILLIGITSEDILFLAIDSMLIFVC